MSGQQAGTIVGGVIGSFIPVVGTQLGAVIGGMIGGWVDPTKVYGPKLTDAQDQTAMDGIPRPYGNGTFPTKGNVIWRDPTVKEHEHTDDGKGSGQEQVTYTYTRSYAIGVCKGPITGYKLVKRNGKIVFDARTDAELTALGYTTEQIAVTRAAQSKFLQKCTFYYGTEDQTPDPTMVAVKGVGNVPGYAGTAYIVMTDDETMKGEVAQYEFVVANCGDRTEDNAPPGWLLITGGSEETGGPLIAYGQAAAVPEFEGIPRSSGADVVGTPAHWRGTWVIAQNKTARVATDITSWSTISAHINCTDLVGGPNGWVMTGSGGDDPYDDTAIAGNPPESFESWRFESQFPAGVPYREHGEETKSANYSGGFYWMDSGAGGELLKTAELGGDAVVLAYKRPDSGDIASFYDVKEWGSALYATCLSAAIGGTWQLLRSTDGGVTWPDVVIQGSTGIAPGQLAANDDVMVCLSKNSGLLWTSEDNFAEARSTGIGVTSAAKGRQIVSSAGRFFIIGRVGGDNSNCVCISTADGMTFSGQAQIPLDGVVGIAASDPSADPDWTPLPDAPGFYVNRRTGEIVGPSGTQISVCKPTLGEIVAEQCNKRSVTTVDVSDLTDEVVGFRVASPSSSQKNISSLMPGYFFDGSEFDGVLHFPKRGGDDSFALTFDDLCERDDGDAIQWERTQEPELLRKITVGYLDPDTTYTATTQQWERRSGTVKAEGESTIELPIVGDKDWAAQAAHMNGKVAWGESDKCTFHTSIAKAALVTAAVGTITDEGGTVHRVRIERIEDEGMLRMVEARRTRADLYQSTTTGAAKPLPRFPGSNIRGPTDGLLLNLPVIVDANDVPGIAWAAAGLLPGWMGGVLQFQRAGEWVEAGRTSVPANMGTLLLALPAHAGDVDTANVLRLRMNDALESVTWVNLLQERNPLAILYPDGTAEIVQFQTATEVAAGEYELTTLLRGRLNTVRGYHDSGARVVFLDTNVHYAALEPTDVGTTLTYRFISNGTDPDAAPVQALDLTTMQSQTEWPVFDMAVEQDGDDFIVTWRKRDRLGTDVFPIRSTNWRGYEVSWSYGGDSHTETVLTETVTFTLPGATDITFSVAQLNLYTGAGPTQTVTIP